MSTSDPSARPFWPGYQTIWRWHFYAGLFCIPFVCFLAITGTIYLFRPQVETWLDRPYENLQSPQTGSPSQAIAAALAANPGWTLHDYQIPRTAQSAAQIILGQNGLERRVYIDRGNLTVLENVLEEQRPMRVIFHLHGELLAGDAGSMIVELAASWTIVMILTGLYLWWPRGAPGLAGVLYPRLGGGKRVFWRDLHAVTGMWVSMFALVMLLSGLPWTKNWGGYLKTMRAATAPVISRLDWSTGQSSDVAAHKAKDAAGELTTGDPLHAEHAGHQHHLALTLTPDAQAALDRIVPTVAALALPPPVLVSPPAQIGGAWAARSDAANRPLRVSLTLDPETGKVITRTGFRQHALIDRMVAVGVAWHEGQLFGWPNQLLGLLIALGLLTMCISAIVLWWRRRAAGVLGAPDAQGRLQLSLGLTAIVVVLGILLPLFGFTLIAVALIERTILRRIPAVRDWLNLTPPLRLNRPQDGPMRETQ